MISVQNLSFSYQKRGPMVLKNINLQLESGKIGILLGKNGSGKTTLFKTILGLEKPQTGSVFIDGEDLSKLSYKERAKRIAYVPQHIHFGAISVFDSILLGRIAYFGTSAGKEDLKVVEEIIEEMGLSAYAYRIAEHLSGGEKQKVAIARAMAQDPKLLIFDEPTGNLDIANEQLLIEEAKKLSREKGIAILSSLHDLNQALDMGDTFFLMKDGELKYAGGEELITPARIKEIFDQDMRMLEVDGQKVMIGGKRHDR